jgi:transposase
VLLAGFRRESGKEDGVFVAFAGGGVDGEAEAAVPVTLTAAERKTLKKRVRDAKTPYRDRRLRAQVVLAAAAGRGSARIAADLGVTADMVRKWRGRFAERGLEGAGGPARSGRPRRISEADRAALIALACQLPAETGVPLSRWTGPELAAELIAQQLVSAHVGDVPAADPGGEPGQAVAVPILDLSPRAGREMRHGDLQAGLGCQRGELGLPQPEP